MHAHCPLSSLPIFLSRSPSALFLACSLHASPSFGTAPLLPPAQPKLNALAASNPSSPSLLLFSDGFSSSPSPQALEPHPTSPPPTSSFSSATLPSLPHLLFSYQPGRTRIHILQAFMMAAAHLCEPACWAASSSPRAGSPLRTRAIPDLPRLTLRCLSLTLLGYNPTPFRCIVGITNLFSFYIILLFYDSIEASN